MNLLIITELYPEGANYNISMKIVDEMRRLGCKVYVAFYDLYGIGIKGKELSDSEFIIQDLETVAFNYKRECIGWRSFSNRERIFYFIRHPKYLRDYLKNRKKSFDKYVKIINDYCIVNSIDAVLGVGFPYEICRITSQLDIGNRNCLQLDPYTFNRAMDNDNEANRQMRLSQEIQVINNINYLFTTDLIKKELVKVNQIAPKESKIIEIEFPLINMEESIEDHFEGIIEKVEGIITFLYAGSFYDNIRPINKLIRIFEDLPDNYVLYLAGREEQIEYALARMDDALKSRIKYVGHLTQKQIEIARNQADFLICYNNIVDNQVPSKLFECINMGKPFLNICQLKECPTLYYTKDYDMVLNVFCENDTNQTLEIIDFVEKMNGKRHDKLDIIKKYKKATVEYVSGQIIEALKSEL